MQDRETEFELKGVRYRAGRLSARAQFHVMRRVGAIFGAFGDASFAALRSPESVPLAALEPVFKALGAMSDADADYVLSELLSVVHREQPGVGWARVQTAGGSIMFADIDNFSDMVQLAFHSLKWNLSDFFSDALSSSIGTTSPTAAELRASNGSHSRKAKAGSSGRSSRGNASSKASSTGR